MLSRSDVPALLAFANFLHKDLRCAETEKKASLTGSFLEDARLHGNLHRMTGVGRNDAPGDDDSFCFARNDGRRGGGGTRLHRVLAPPGVSLCQPEDVEAGSVTRLRHMHGLVERLHTQLQNANFERKTHRSFLGSLRSHHHALFLLARWAVKPLRGPPLK